MAGPPLAEQFKGIRCRGFTLFVCAVALFLVGGIGVNVIHHVPNWNTHTFYQLHTVCFLLGISILVTCVGQYLLHKAASEKQPEKAKKIRLWLWLALIVTFIFLVLGAFGLGNFIRESEVFGNCSNNDNTTGVEIEEVGRLKDISAVGIVFILLSFFGILGICNERKPENELLFSKNAYKRSRAIFRLFFQAVCFGIYALVFFIIFGLSISFTKTEPDWDSSSWQQLYYGAIVAGVTILAVSLSLFILYRAVRTSKEDKVTECISRLHLVLMMGFIGILICTVFLGSFVNETGVFGKCRTAESAAQGTLIADKKDRGTLHGLAAACIALFVISYIAITGECCDRDIIKDELIWVKVDQPKTQTANKTDNKNAKQQDKPKAGAKVANNKTQPEQPKSEKKATNNTKQEKPKDGTKAEIVTKQAEKSTDGSKVEIKTIQIEQAKDGSKTLGTSTSQPDKTPGVNGTRKNVQNKKETASPRSHSANNRDRPGVVSVGIGNNQDKQKESQIELLRIQNERLQEQNLLLQHEIQRAREFQQQPLSSATLMSQVYGHGGITEAMMPPVPVIPSNQQLLPIRQYAFVNDVTIAPPPSYNETMLEQTSRETPKDSPQSSSQV